MGGAFPPNKLTEPPDELKLTMVTMGDRREMEDAKIITTENGRQLRTGTGTSATCKSIGAGKVILGKAKVACEGRKRKIPRRKLRNTQDLATVWVQLAEGGVAQVEGHRPGLKEGNRLWSRSHDLGGCTRKVIAGR